MLIISFRVTTTGSATRSPVSLAISLLLKASQSWQAGWPLPPLPCPILCEEKLTKRESRAGTCEDPADKGGDRLRAIARDHDHQVIVITCRPLDYLHPEEKPGLDQRKNTSSRRGIVDATGRFVLG